MRGVYLASVWLHVLAAMTWIGGMVVFVAAVMPYFRRQPEAVKAAFLSWFGPRFRAVSWTCLAILASTGTFNLWARGVRLADFLRPERYATAFGRLLLLKLTLVAVAVLLTIVHRKPRCIACGNCVVACPFGVPEVYEDRKLMMKCDMCYDRTSIGKKPMCATVCPSQALFYGTAEEIALLRPRSAPTNRFQFGLQTITTRVFVMAPKGLVRVAPLVDVTAALADGDDRRPASLRMAAADVFEEVEI